MCYLSIYYFRTEHLVLELFLGNTDSSSSQKTGSYHVVLDPTDTSRLQPCTQDSGDIMEEGVEKIYEVEQMSTVRLLLQFLLLGQKKLLQ